MTRKRKINAFSLSFLDIMACGFGAVTLLFLIMKHNVNELESDPNLRAEIDLMTEDIRYGEDNLVKLRNTLEKLDQDAVEAQGLSRRILEKIDITQQEISAQEDPKKEIAVLRKKVVEVENEIANLEEASQDNDTRQFLGQGDRQYLTGLKLGGTHILILLDASASMLAEDIVNVIRRRNMSNSAIRQSEKWRRAVKTTEWLVAQMPANSKIQVLPFNTKTHQLLDEGYRWITASDTVQTDELFDELNRFIPGKGTSLINAFKSLNNFSPRPNNLFLITDGLPTLAEGSTNKRTISGRDRLQLFGKAVEMLPKGIPVNTILFPFEGDPAAAASFWRLSIVTNGSFLSPAKDWP